MKYPIITICGSLRAGREVWDKIAYELSLQGYVVLTVNFWEYDLLHSEDSQMQEIKEMLDDVHKQKIRMSNEIFVIDIVNGKKYVGRSTQSEIDYAEKKGIPIQYYSKSVYYTPIKK